MQIYQVPTLNFKFTTLSSRGARHRVHFTFVAIDSALAKMRLEKADDTKATFQTANPNLLRVVNPNNLTHYSPKYLE